jgi:Ni/Fe-hydrogenase 1 B-type cytochrome subunit
MSPAGSSSPPGASLADVTGIDDAAVAQAPRVGSVYVYQAPVRLWHWVNALSILVLAVTGYFIGSPLPAMPGEASDHFVMGYIRFAHFAAGYVLAIGLLGRVYWAFVGNHHARELFYLPLTRAAYWREVIAMAAWYAFVRPRPNQYVGHNPLARLAMFFGVFLLSVFMICTGFALYGEGAQAGSWSHTLFSSWVIPLMGQSQDVHTWHHLGMWGLVVFVITHVYSAIREEIMGRQSMVSTMISGYRTFKD